MKINNEIYISYIYGPCNIVDLNLYVYFILCMSKHGQCKLNLNTQQQQQQQRQQSLW